MADARERLGKHVPTATDTHTKMNGVVCAGRRGKQISSVEAVRKRGSLKGVAIQRGLERVKLKNLHC
jgi:hypothetical protein